MSASASASASTPAAGVAAAPSPQILLFARAVLAILDIWPALTIAVKEEWGGVESKEKKTWMASTVIDEFEGGAQWVKDPSSPSTLIVDPKSESPLDFDDLADLLSQMLSDEFDANLEDGSIDLVSRDLLKVWDTIVQKPRGEAEATVAALENVKGQGVKVKATKGSGPDVGEDGEAFSDDSDDDEGEWSDEDEDEGMEVDERPKEKEKEKVEKVVDEDGFELVQKGKGKKK